MTTQEALATLKGRTPHQIAEILQVGGFKGKTSSFKCPLARYLNFLTRDPHKVTADQIYNCSTREEVEVESGGVLNFIIAFDVRGDYPFLVEEER